MDQEFRDRFIKLETNVENFIEYSKETSDKRHMENTEHFRKIFSWLEELPCKSNSEKMRGLALRMNWLYVLLGSFIIVITGVLLRTAMAG